MEVLLKFGAKQEMERGEVVWYLGWVNWAVRRAFREAEGVV